MTPAYGSRIVTAVLTLAASLWAATAEAAGGVATTIGMRRLDNDMWNTASSQTASVAKGFNIGLDLHRLSGTSLELLGTQTDADGLSGSLSFGWSWGDWIAADPARSARPSTGTPPGRSTSGPYF